MTTSASTRLYVVAATDTGLERIIRAESKARAVAASAVARIATQSDLERLLTVGVMAEAPEGMLPLDFALEESDQPKRGRPKGRRDTHPRKARPAAMMNRSSRHV